MDAKTERQITQIVRLLQEVFQKDFLGLYLFGSAILGGLQKYSDIDILAVVDRPSTPEDKAKIVRELEKISGIYMKEPKRPIELTIVVKSEVNPWRYPPIFDFQYGEWLREAFDQGSLEPWESKEMPDLAMMITQVFLASQTIYGADPGKLLDRVPYADFLRATTKEIDNMLRDLEWDTRNVLLTLARMWSSLETDAIWSKPGAASWAIGRLPEEYQDMLARARAVCVGEEEEGWEDLQEKVRPCAEYMVGKIKERADRLQGSDLRQRVIKVGKQSNR
jgi:streptomycin 3"-adenylyltransferase